MPDIKKKDIECPKCGDFVRVRVLKETIGDARWDDLNERFIPDTTDYFTDGIKNEPVITSKVIECKKCGARWTDDDDFMGAMQRGKEKRERRESKGWICNELHITCDFEDDDFTNCFMCEEKIKLIKEIERRRNEETKDFAIDGFVVSLKFLDRLAIGFGDTIIWGTSKNILDNIKEDKTCDGKCGIDYEYFYIEGGLGNYDERGTCCSKCFGVTSRKQVFERSKD